VLDLPERVCQERNKTRSDRNFGAHVIAHQRQHLRLSLKNLKREGFNLFWVKFPAACSENKI
jgi:protein phosphatase